MAGKSDYLEQAILEHIFGISTYSPPATLYIGLYTSNPTDAGGGTEVSGGSYARVAVTNDDTKWNRTDSVVSNVDPIDFAQATALWGTITSVGVFDSSTGGNLLFWAPLTASRTVNNGDQVGFAIGQLQFVED